MSEATENTDEKPCPCGSKRTTLECCTPLMKGKKAATPEALMRSRYTAHAVGEIDYLMETVYPSKRKEHDRDAVKKWSREAEWLGLEILECKDGGVDDNTGSVEFLAHYRNKSGKQRHHELAEFKKKEGHWYFWDAKAPQVQTFQRAEVKVGRNDPCSCGSGKKFKKCCGK